jgi:hypothetical protein
VAAARGGERRRAARGGGGRRRRRRAATARGDGGPGARAARRRSWRRRGGGRIQLASNWTLELLCPFVNPINVALRRHVRNVHYLALPGLTYSARSPRQEALRPLHGWCQCQRTRRRLERLCACLTDAAQPRDQRARTGHGGGRMRTKVATWRRAAAAGAHEERPRDPHGTLINYDLSADFELSLALRRDNYRCGS